jgi:hypothetical protein
MYDPESGMKKCSMFYISLFLVCVGSININHKTDLATMKTFENCTVLEGSFQINSALLDYQKEKSVQILSLWI